MTDDKMREAFGAFWATQRQAFDPTWAPSFIGELREMAEDAWAAALTAQAQEIEALRAQVQDQALHLISAHAQAEEAHADAQRYRKLREADPDAGPAVFEHRQNDWGNWFYVPLHQQELDALVDAMQQQEAAP